MDLHLRKDCWSTYRLHTHKRKKKINWTLNFEAYSSFEGAQNCHSKDTREPTREYDTNSPNHASDGSSLNNKDISNKYTIAARNKFDTLQEIFETLTPNEEYINSHIVAAGECIPTKLRAKHKVTWKTIAVRKKHHNLKTASLCNERRPSNAKSLKLKKPQKVLINTYQKEQMEYVQGQINKIRNTVEDKQSRIAWQTVNDVCKSKSISTPKLSVAG